MLLSVQFSCSVVSDSLQPYGLQNARLPCPSPTPGAYSNSSPSSRWCHPTVSSSYRLLLLPSIFPSIRVWWICGILELADKSVTVITKGTSSLLEISLLFLLPVFLFPSWIHLNIEIKCKINSVKARVSTYWEMVETGDEEQISSFLQFLVK